MVTHVVPKQLHDKGGDAAVDANEDVDAGEDHVCRAGDFEEEGGGVHQRSDGPPGNTDRLELRPGGGPAPFTHTRRAAAGGRAPVGWWRTRRRFVGNR